jgi:mannose/cellobiose epimerase-like protein (N-acyl-D-glucosamine 2-epimerase family)
MNNAPIARQAQEALQRHVVAPLLSRIIDEDDGGFLVDFDDRWRPVGLHEKSLEYIARTTSAFAQIARAMPGQGYDRYVLHGCSFLQQAMWDHIHGGFFCRVDRIGRPMWEGLKHPHAATYAGRAFLLAEPFLASGEGLVWSNRTLAWLDDVAWDSSYGGYWGSFRRDNQRYADWTRLPTPDGRDVCGLVPGFKDINTHGDAIEFLTCLAERETAGHCIRRLQTLAEIVANQLIQPNGAMPYRYLPDWRPAPDLDRVGYNFQVARYLLSAAALLPTVDAVAEASRLVDFCLSSARHPAGGFCFAVAADGRTWPTRGASSDSRQWWVQIEAVHALHLLANVSPPGSATRTRYRHARDEQWQFVRGAFFDERYGGLHEVAGDSQDRSLRHRLFRLLRSRRCPLALKSHAWKDASHEVNLFLALASSELSEEAPVS